ncbi:MAG TPA: L-seryl-tRNA(Sec) selenium transferase [Aggregatilineales bacterium]|nr:L-seryl-tRNA(Sec) selenium transferase [Aggregatilineales bacterium]
MTDSARLRHLPSMDRLLREPGGSDLVATYGRAATRDALRVALNAAREWIRQGGVSPGAAELVTAAGSYLRSRQGVTLRPVINATGVILHTNLGRAALSESAQQAIAAMASGYSSLEYDLEEARRGSRDSHVAGLLTSLTGAEAAMVVNNNAAAVMLILAVLAQGKDVIISRGHLVEIGGGFRMPDVMAASGAHLVEVGATNRTHLDDYTQAFTPQTALILRVHASNFQQIGFTEQPDAQALTAVAHAHSVQSVYDLGSGALLDTAPYGLDHEPTIQEALRAGFDLVAFSGDKLLGGPQAGIIVGRSTLIERLKRHPFARAMRIDKLSLAGLFATLGHYHRNDALSHIPVWQMIAMQGEAIRARAETWAARVGGDVINSESTIGGGSLPGDTLPTYVLALDVQEPDAVAAHLRRFSTPVIVRIAHNRVLLDPRTVLPSQDSELMRTLESVLGELGESPEAGDSHQANDSNETDESDAPESEDAETDAETMDSD